MLALGAAPAGASTVGASTVGASTVGASTVGASTVTTASTAATTSTTAPVAGLAADQARAAQIAAQIAADGHRLDVLAEAADAAAITAAQEQAALRDADARLAATDRAVDSARRLLAAQALAEYTDAGGSLSPQGPALTSVAPDLVGGYGAVVAGTEHDAIAALHRVRAVQAAAQASARAAAAAASAASAALVADRASAEAAQKAQVALLAGVQGDMATLVAAAEAQRAAAAAALEQRALSTSSPTTATPAATTGAPSTTGAAPTTGLATTTTAAAATRSPSTTASPRPTTAPTTARPSASTTTTVPPAPPTTVGPPAPSSGSGGVPAQSPGAAAALRYARAQIGKPYQWGGAGPDSFDCSGLVMMAWQQGGVDFPHLAQDQYDMTAREPLSAAQPGDLIFFGTPSNVYHVGIYVGGGQMIDAPQTGEDVQQQSIYWTDLLGAGRVSG